MTLNEKIDQYMAEFDEKFPSVESYSQRNGDYTETPLPYLKSFLRSHLESIARERDGAWSEKLEEMIALAEKWYGDKQNPIYFLNRAKDEMIPHGDSAAIHAMEEKSKTFLSK